MARNAWIAALGALLVGSLQLPGPWPDDYGAMNGAIFYSQMARSFDLLGFEETRGRPYLSVVPSEPPQPVANAEYLNHPPLWAWLNYGVRQAFGADREPWVYRLPGLLAHGLLAALLALFAHQAAGPRAGLGAALLAALSPTTLNDGANPCFESAVLCMVLAALLTQRALRGRPKWQLFVVPLLLLVGVLVDWLAGLFGAAVALAEWWRPAAQRRWWRPLLFAWGPVAAVAAVIGWWHWSGTDVGALGSSFKALVFSFASGEGTTSADPAAPWWPTMGEHALRAFGWSGLGLAALGLLLGAWAPARGARADPAQRPLRDALGLALGGSLAIGVFAQHAAKHEFWIVYLWPCVVLLSAAAFAAIDRWSSTAAALLLGLVLVAGVGEGVATFAERDDGSVRRAEEMAALAEAPGDLLVFPSYLQSSLGALREPYVVGLMRAEEHALLHLATSHGLVPWRGWTMIVPEPWLALHGAEIEALAKLPGVKRRELTPAEAPLVCSHWGCERVVVLSGRGPR